MKSTQRIGLLLTLVFLLPALFFSVYEISSLNKEEEMIQEIYNKQLEAILFSVNQYSDDLLNTWISKTQAGLEEASSDSIPPKVKDLLVFNSSLHAIFICDTVDGMPVQKYFSLDVSARERLQKNMEEALSVNEDQLNQLIGYKRSGFQKVEALRHHWKQVGNLQCLVFIVEDTSEHMRIAALIIKPDVFIQDLVGPRLQVIAKDQFILSVFRSDVSYPIYSTITSDTVTTKSAALTKDFWLFPNYSLGIRTKGSSIHNLVRERTTTNLFLLISMDIILVIAVVLVFRNVKKEVQLAQNKSDFVSNVSHEIRTPLALISMFAETLEMGRVQSEEKKQEYYGIISKETHRLSGIVNKILTFSQTEANKKIFHPQPLHVRSEIEEILMTYDYHLRSKGFEYTFSHTADTWIMADREAFIETVINLIDNAVKYSPDKKKIDITTGIANGYGTVCIKDQGIGISFDEQKHIFDKFYRVPSGNLAKSRGTGLGLSLVKQLMEAQLGKVTVSSGLGRGSAFTLHFPLQPES